MKLYVNSLKIKLKFRIIKTQHKQFLENEKLKKKRIIKSSFVKKKFLKKMIFMNTNIITLKNSN